MIKQYLYGLIAIITGTMHAAIWQQSAQSSRSAQDIRSTLHTHCPHDFLEQLDDIIKRVNELKKKNKENLSHYQELNQKRDTIDQMSSFSKLWNASDIKELDNEGRFFQKSLDDMRIEVQNTKRQMYQVMQTIRGDDKCASQVALFLFVYNLEQIEDEISEENNRADTSE